MPQDEERVLELRDVTEEDPAPWEDDYKTAMRPIVTELLKEYVWDDDRWDLFKRANISEIRFHDLSEEDLLMQASFLDFDDEDTIRRLKTGAEWEPSIPSDDTVIRRYLSFDRFVDLISNGGFWLSNINEFDDVFEASFPTPSVNHSQLFANVAQDNGRGNQVTYGVKKRRERDKHTYVNCWRIGEDESSIFWDAYLGETDGLAIQTTIGDLRTNIEGEVWDGYIDTLLQEGVTKAIQEFSKLLIGEVNYLDYDSEPVSNSKMSPARFFHKRHGFEDEKEFRLVKTPQPLTAMEDPPDPRDGIILKADLEPLINKVVLPPRPSESYEGMVREVVEGLLDIPVEDSVLTQEPDQVELKGI